ncbi:MAG TPA: hypothetical protein DEF34_03420 [Desulfotomaculum sp.]|nr:MAG: hypothetical protein JL56_03030 [Desulfotomaculum sp. BICA1-6]HBX22678.1 hypothetical protein [Desulfotomaculum sp.]
MPLTIPEYITVKTADGATAAYLSPEADGLKDVWVNNELNGRCTMDLSLPLLSDKWQYLNNFYRIYTPDITGNMREFVILNPDAIEKKRDGKKLWGKVTAHESWVLLGKKFATISNDPQTPEPPALAVIILSGGSDLSGGQYNPGTAGHALHAVLQSTGWTVGTVDVTGIHDLETEKTSVLANVNQIQKTWGGYLVWDSLNKTVSLRDEGTWAPYTGYQVRYAKNLKNITRNEDTDIVTKLYPFGADDLDISSVNGGQIYIENTSYTSEELAEIWVNQDIHDPQELLDEATKHLAKVCKPRYNYRVKQVDRRTQSGFQHEDFDTGHMADLIDEDLSIADQARIIGYRFNVFQPWQCELEVGDPIEKVEAMFQDSRAMVKYLDSIKTTRGQITAYKLVNESLIAEKIAKAAVDATKLNTKVVVLLADQWTNNNPAGGSVSWNQHKLYYAGQEFVMQAGNTAQKYIYWNGADNNYSTSATEPTLADGQFIVVVNNAGLHDTVWDKGYAREFIGSAFIANAAIKSAHIENLAVLNSHIANLDANKINVTDLTALSSEDGYTKLQGDGMRVYDAAGKLLGHIGRYNVLDTQTATFARASVAYLSDGTQVASGIPRYEYMRQPAPVWQDLFDADLLAKYTSGGDTPATWAVSGGVLTGTGGTQATLIKNDLLLQDVEIEVNIDQADNGGVIARYQDSSNYYLLTLSDDSSSLASQNLRLFKRVGGAFAQLGVADVTWTRGTVKTVKFTLHGSRLEVWFDGTKIVSVTDSAFTGGGVGLRNNSSFAARYLDFKVYHAQQSVMIEEGVANLLTANRASVETDLTGLGMAGTHNSKGTLSRITTDAWHGSACAQVVVSGYEVGNDIALATTPESTALAVSPSTAYSFSTYGKAPVGIQWQIRVVEWNSSGGVVKNTTISSQTGIGSTVADPWRLATGVLTTQATTAYVSVRLQLIGNGTFKFDGLSVIQKAYPLSWQLPGATRAAEVMTAPTAGILNVAEGEISLDVYVDPNGPHSANAGWCMPFSVVTIQASPYAELNQISVRKGILSNAWTINFSNSEGTAASIPLGNITTPGVYRFTASWKSGVGGYGYLNGVLKGSVGASYLPSAFASTMCIGSWNDSGIFPVNSPISNFQARNRMRSDAEILAEYNTGLPLAVDKDTTYLMTCDGTLQPTARAFGFFAKNGRFILLDPQAGQGIEVWDGATRKVLIGRLDDGTIGQEIVGGKFLSPDIQLPGGSGQILFGAEGDTDSPEIIYDAGAKGKTRIFYNWMTGQDPALYINNLGRIDFQAFAPVISGVESLGINTIFGDNAYNLVQFQSDVDVTGTFTCADKFCTEKTSLGTVGLYALEAPENRYVDKGRGELVNGQCIIDLTELPPFIECIEPDSEQAMWHVELTPMGPFTPYVVEVNGVEAYIAVASIEPGINGKFTWSVSGIRKNRAGRRFPRMEWLVGGDEENDPVLQPGWEDELSEIAGPEPEGDAQLMDTNWEDEILEGL